MAVCMKLSFVLLSFLLVQGSKAVRQPFRIIWNQASSGCHSHHIDFNLAQYGIESNPGMAWYGDKVGTLYSTRFGAWPYVDRKNTSHWINGGLPQYVNMTKHLQSTRDYVSHVVPNSSSDFSIIDFEAWYPLYNTNDVFVRTQQYNEIARLYPDLTKEQLEAKAEEIWDPAASLAWLWKITTGFFPSIYVRPQDIKQTFDAMNKRQTTFINETYRMRALYSNPDTPIMPFTLVQHFDGYRLTGQWLDLAIVEPIEKGVDGLIIWGSDRYFKPTNPKCQEGLQYLVTYLGPTVKNLLTKMTNCSAQLCGGNGRCVNKKYADVIVHALDRGVKLPDNIPIPIEVPPNNSTVRQEYIDNYYCQCYTGWTGSWCRFQYERNST